MGGTKPLRWLTSDSRMFRSSGVTSAIAREMNRDAVSFPEAGSFQRMGGPNKARRISRNGGAPPALASASRNRAWRSRFISRVRFRKMASKSELLDPK